MSSKGLIYISLREFQPFRGTTDKALKIFGRRVNCWQTQRQELSESKPPAVCAPRWEWALPWKSLAWGAASPSCSTRSGAQRSTETELYSCTHLGCTAFCVPASSSSSTSCASKETPVEDTETLEKKPNQQTNKKKHQTKKPNNTENNSRNKTNNPWSLPLIIELITRLNWKQYIFIYIIFLLRFHAGASPCIPRRQHQHIVCRQLCCQLLHRNHHELSLSFYYSQQLNFHCVFSYLFKIRAENIFITQILQISDTAFLFLENRGNQDASKNFPLVYLLVCLFTLMLHSHRAGCTLHNGVGLIMLQTICSNRIKPGQANPFLNSSVEA